MVLSLMESEKIMVQDMNLEARMAHEHTAQLYALKRDVFEHIEKKVAPAALYDFVPIEGVDWGSKVVRLSFSTMLQDIIYKMEVPVTPIDILDLGEGMFSASMYVAVPSKKCKYRSIKGDRMPTSEAAEESLAQKTIFFLMSKYHFEVDVNFHFLNSTAAAFVKERSSYINVKERVYGFPEEKEPSQQHGLQFT